MHIGKELKRLRIPRKPSRSRKAPLALPAPEEAPILIPVPWPRREAAPKPEPAKR
jgi:hypothetical protein